MTKPFITFGTIFLAILYHSSCVEAQCLTSNDARVTTPDNDLSGIQKFNIDLFQQVYPSNPHENLIFSPYSVWNSLVLAYFGSGGRTEEQFRQVLNVNDKLETLRKWRQLEASYTMRQDTSQTNTFVLSNRAYFDTSVVLRHCMEDILHNEIKSVEFMKDPTSAANRVNKFVAETTRGHITHMVSPVDVSLAHMVLVNAAFFKGTWVSPFDPENTKVQPFETLTGKSIDVDMMSQFGDVKWGFNEDVQIEVLGLPYAGEKLYMYLFLPYETGKRNFDQMIKSLSSQVVDSLLSGAHKTKMQLFLPKFKLDTVIEDNLIKGLFNMGLRDPFVKKVANFTDFSFDLDLSLDRGIHKAFIDVNEEGTKAGAATAFIANKIGGSSMFVCNRPFLFMIRDDQNENILFIGVVKSPPPASKSSSPARSPTNTPRPSSDNPSSFNFPRTGNVPDSINIPRPVDVPDISNVPRPSNFPDISNIPRPSNFPDISNNPRFSNLLPASNIAPSASDLGVPQPFNEPRNFNIPQGSSVRQDTGVPRAPSASQASSNPSNNPGTFRGPDLPSSEDSSFGRTSPRQSNESEDSIFSFLFRKEKEVKG